MQEKVLAAHRSPLEPAYMLLEMGDQSLKRFEDGVWAGKRLQHTTCIPSPVTEFFIDMLLAVVKHIYQELICHCHRSL